MLLPNNLCSASSCFHSRSGGRTWSDELQNAFDYVSDKFWSLSCILWGNKHKLDWCCLPDGWRRWGSFETYFHGDSGKEERTQVKSYISYVLREPLQACSILSICLERSCLELTIETSDRDVGCSPLCSAICLFIPWIFLEKPKMDARGTWDFHPLILTLNSLCTFALNLSVFLVITHTSALTIRVAGVVKDWVVVLLSALLFADTKLTLINLFGYGIGKYLNIFPLLFSIQWSNLSLRFNVCFYLPRLCSRGSSILYLVLLLHLVVLLAKLSWLTIIYHI